MKYAKHQYTILNQICKIIPQHIVPKLARTYGIDKQARSFLTAYGMAMICYNKI